jgi:hypothetical protein
MKHWLLFGLLVCQLTFAQMCSAELRGTLTDDDLQTPATGVDAADFIHQAVEVLEPALPRLAYLPDPFDYMDIPSAVFTAEHGLLPALWEPGTLSFEVWQEMVIGLAAWYDINVDISPDLTKAGLLQTLESLVTQASPQLRPVALVASRQDDPNKVAFWAVVRNHSLYPRIIVHRPLQDDGGLGDGVKTVLPLLSNCAQQISNYIFANEDTAKNLFLSNTDARMIVASTYPVRAEEITYVPVGEETAYLTFASPELEPYTTYAALFEGSGPGPFMVARLIPQVRTNMNPKEVLDFVLGK